MEVERERKLNQKFESPVVPRASSVRRYSNTPRLLKHPLGMVFSFITSIWSSSPLSCLSDAAVMKSKCDLHGKHSFYISRGNHICLVDSLSTPYLFGLSSVEIDDRSLLISRKVNYSEQVCWQDNHALPQPIIGLLSRAHPPIRPAYVLEIHPVHPMVHAQMLCLQSRLESTLNNREGRAEAVRKTLLCENRTAIHMVGACIHFPGTDCDARRCRDVRTSQFLGCIFSQAAQAIGAQLNNYDLFHAHLVHDGCQLVMLFHAREYPAFDKDKFPIDLGFCQRTSKLYPTAVEMRTRCAMWLPNHRHLVVLDAGDRPLGTIYESEFGVPVADVFYFNRQQRGSISECTNRGVYVVTM